MIRFLFGWIPIFKHMFELEDYLDKYNIPRPPKR